MMAAIMDIKRELAELREDQVSYPIPLNFTLIPTLTTTPPYLSLSLSLSLCLSLSCEISLCCLTCCFLVCSLGSLFVGYPTRPRRAPPGSRSRCQRSRTRSCTRTEPIICKDPTTIVLASLLLQRMWFRNRGLGVSYPIRFTMILLLLLVPRSS
jgi:hypothetical protein